MSRRTKIVLLIAGITCGIDQLSKLWSLKWLLPHGPVYIINDFFLFLHVINKGAAFSLFYGKKWWLIGISILVMIIGLWFYKKIKSDYWMIPLSFGLLLGGTGGNLIDRLFREGVVDFIYFNFWPTFNIADMCINIGVWSLLIYFLFIESKLEKKNGTNTF
ncbi:signal peptidase II [Candidatus Margulisiibacteriota bacterium]